ncbi:MAG: tryptophan 7-halogenase [Hyphomonadaceae bacterium]|nr:MAG: FADH2 O2-dependent halogenase I [Caulobacteraceae bacterium]MBT9445787.1 tryptophan 7-halogenase [Hyphomonadaceae bacterium]
MQTGRIRRVAIVGGGSAGWMTAAALSKLLAGIVEVELVESDEIGIIGVGEATIPQIRNFNDVLELDEDEFIRTTRATFKLGIEFRNWRSPGHAYLHTFGDNGMPLGRTPFHHYWLKARQLGMPHTLWDFSPNAQAARLGRFSREPFEMGRRSTSLAWAFHFDAALYARYLRSYAEGRGVRRTEGTITRVDLCPESGFIRSVMLESGRSVAADFFIDCSGFRALLLGEALGVGYEDWSHWLPCNRALAVPSANVGPPRPFTQSIAHGAGWQWRIPLQHRTGNGHVFSSSHVSEDEATATLLANLEGEPLAEPRLIRFTTGRRKKFWAKNCVALGLASGFLEPLESTSIHLVQSGVSRLLSLFPNSGVNAAEIDEYNRQCGLEFARVRDFIILHYLANERTDSPFWTDCRNMAPPEDLVRKIALFRANGAIYRDQEDLFAEASWLQVMYGQGIEPQGYHPMADQISDTALGAFLTDLRAVIGGATAAMPAHEEYIRSHCAADHV